MKRILTATLCAAILASGCAHDRKARFEQALKTSQCDTALENIPEHDDNIKFLGRVDRAAQSTLSYAATGAGYASDVVLTIVGGAVIVVGLCAPIIAVAAIASIPVDTHAMNDISCLPMPAGVKPPSNGSKIYRATEEMRCPDLTALSKSVRRVAGCYERTEDKTQIEKAQTSLRSLLKNKEFMGCVSPAEKALVQMDLDRVTGKAALK